MHCAFRQRWILLAYTTHIHVWNRQHWKNRTQAWSKRLLLSKCRNVKQALQTLAIITKIIGKTAYMLFMAVKNLLFISVEVLHSLIPSRESEVRTSNEVKWRTADRASIVNTRRLNSHHEHFCINCLVFTGRCNNHCYLRGILFWLFWPAWLCFDRYSQHHPLAIECRKKRWTHKSRNLYYFFWDFMDLILSQY